VSEGKNRRSREPVRIMSTGQQISPQSNADSVGKEAVQPIRHRRKGRAEKKKKKKKTREEKESRGRKGLGQVD